MFTRNIYFAICKNLKVIEFLLKKFFLARLQLYKFKNLILILFKL